MKTDVGSDSECQGELLVFPLDGALCTVTKVDGWPWLRRRCEQNLASARGGVRDVYDCDGTRAAAGATVATAVAAVARSGGDRKSAQQTEDREPVAHAPPLVETLSTMARNGQRISPSLWPLPQRNDVA